MNKIKLLRRLTFVAVLTLVIFSCTTIQTGLQNVRIGMTRSEVVARLGNSYEVISMAATQEGQLEVLRYTEQKAEDGKFVPYREYILHFLNDKLVELNTIDADKMQGRPNRPNRGGSRY